MKIKLNVYFGGDKPKEADSPPPYNPTTDPGYREAAKLLKQLRPGFEKARHKMTMDEIIASLPQIQRDILNAQKVPTVAAPSADWGAINNLRTQVNPQAFNPVFAPQNPGSLFNGPQSINPTQLNTPVQNFVYQASLLGQPPNGVK
jgi:hypothetical protein